METRTREFRGKQYTISAAHPATDLFPWISDDELQQLIDSIKTEGLHHPIIRLADGRIVSGRHREFACIVAGIKPYYIDRNYTNEEAIRLVMSEDITRRHLTPGQRAMIAAELANLLHGQNKSRTSKPSELPATTQGEAAASMHVSTRLVTKAVRVKRETPELTASVREGKLGLETAEALTQLRTEAIKRVRRAKDMKKAARRELLKAKQAQLAMLPKTQTLILVLDAGIDLDALWNVIPANSIHTRIENVNPKKAADALKLWFKAQLASVAHNAEVQAVG